MLQIKEGVIIRRWKDEIWVAATVVQQVWNYLELPDDPWITSGFDGKHSINSFHYLDLALDFRTKNLPEERMKVNFFSETRRRLKNVSYRYDIALEYLGGNNEHLHLEFDTRKA